MKSVSMFLENWPMNRLLICQRRQGKHRANLDLISSLAKQFKIKLNDSNFEMLCLNSRQNRDKIGKEISQTQKF